MIKKIIRDDVQFLRGLSVLLIFFFHFELNTFKYFYVGVDIFFVISGYVITNAIFNNIKYKNDYDFFDYSLKRVKRIYPNLISFLIIFNILFFSYIYINDGIYFEITISSLTTIFGLSNFYYILNPNLGYFDEAIKWLQHTWSLSVELQFYLFYGVLISILFSFKKILNIKKTLIYLLIILSGISFYLFIFGTGKYLSSYYFSPSRFWEFFLGALIYLVSFEKFIKIKKMNFTFFIFFFVILLTLINFISINLDYRIVIILVILPISYCLIFNKTIKLFSINNFFKFYGNISYSFFLWHLPIISFIKLNVISNFISFFISILITTLISYLSYRFIELPFNKKTNFDHIFKRVIKVFSLFLLILSISIFLNHKLIYDIRDNFFKNIIKIYPKIRNVNKSKISDNVNNNWVLQFDNCDNKNESFSWYTRTNCIIENSKKSLFYILGNSYGDHLVPAIFGLDKKLSIYKARFENCYINTNKDCKNRTSIILKRYKKISENFDNNILIISLNAYEVSYKKLTNVLEQLPSNIKVVYIYPHPSTETFSDNTKFNDYKIKKKENLLILKKIEDRFNFVIFDPYIYLCPDEYCNIEDYNNYFTDGEHFKLSTSKFFTKILKNFFN